MKRVIKSTVTAATSMNSRLASEAESLANDLNDFLAETSSIPNLSDFLDEYDIEHIMRAADALQSIGEAYNK